jgi:phosphate transport system substrate-binding protein
MKRINSIFLLLALVAVSAAPVFASGSSDSIEVVSREDGSGTRGAFIELFGIEVKGADGSKKDTTTKEAVIAKQTDVMMTSIAGNKNAIGYISLGSLNGTVKALSIDGVPPSAENVENGSYKAARPFFVAINPGLESAAPGLMQEFLDFILSKQGQEVVAKSYIPVQSGAEFKSRKPAGKIVVAGSSSVTPIMEKLKEAYLALNPYGAIEIQMSDSSAGLSACIDGICDIAMSSRALKDAEASGLQAIQIATDGIAVIVNNDNPLNNLSSAEVQSIFTGEKTKWSE